VSRTLPDGQVNQHSVDVTCDKAVQSCTKIVTGHNGG
jgi:cystathionine beta-lyase/cystathionine gamma-synthase